MSCCDILQLGILGRAAGREKSEEGRLFRDILNTQKRNNVWKSLAFLQSGSVMKEWRKCDLWRAGFIMANHCSGVWSYIYFFL